MYPNQMPMQMQQPMPMQQQPQYRQPNYNQFQPQVQPVPPQSNIIEVNGIQGAEAYPLPPNSVFPLFDMNGDRFFLKSSDAGGFCTIKTYSFIEETQKQNNKEKQEFATKSELEELKKQIESVLKQKPPSKTTKSESTST